MPPEEESSLDRLEKRLYSGAPGVDQIHRRERPGGPHDVPHAWNPEPLPMASPKKRRSLATTFFIVAALFFVAAVGIAAYLILSGNRSVSTSNIAITMQGPTTIAAGEVVPLSIVIENRNPVDLSDAEFTVSFPEGTRSADDVTKPYPRYAEHFDSIPMGGKLERSIKAVVFGEESQTISIPVELTYRTAGSNAVFVKQATYQLTVSTAPLTVTVTNLAETVSGQSLTLDISVRSNATKPIQNAVLEAEYPFGFTLTQASPAGTNGVFSLGKLDPGQVKEVRVTGVLTGENGGSRVFRFTAGTADSTGNLSVAYTSKEAAVALATPFLAVALAVNGADADGAVVTPGKQVHATVTWKNALTTSVSDAQVKVSLSGAVDPASVTVDRGFYQSADQTILFDRDTDPSLSSLAPGASGVGSFTFTVPNNAGGSTKNSSIALVISIAGNRTSEAMVPEQVSASQTKTIKVVGNLTLSTISEHVAGPFKNTGPVPPTANQSTTYTAVWRVNAGSAVAGTKVVATLPTYVKYTGSVSPAGEPLVYDSATSKLTWTIGDLAAGASRDVAFQVSVLPSISQRSTSPVLVSAPVLTAYDRFAQTPITFTGAAITTETPGDTGYVPGQGEVQ